MQSIKCLSMFGSTTWLLLPTRSIMEGSDDTARYSWGNSVVAVHSIFSPSLPFWIIRGLKSDPLLGEQR